MKLTPDDPRLTAYALGELDASERAAIEAELKQNPKCRQAVEEIQSAAKMLSQELAGELVPELSTSQRKQISEKLEPTNIIPFPWWKFSTIGLAALAASVMFVVAWQVWFSPNKTRMAELTAPKSSAVENRKENFKQPISTVVSDPTDQKKESPPLAPVVVAPPIERPEVEVKTKFVEVSPAENKSVADDFVPNAKLDTVSGKSSVTVNGSGSAAEPVNSPATVTGQMALNQPVPTGQSAVFDRSGGGRGGGGIGNNPSSNPEGAFPAEVAKAYKATPVVASGQTYAATGNRNAPAQSTSSAATSLNDLIETPASRLSAQRQQLRSPKESGSEQSRTLDFDDSKAESEFQLAGASPRRERVPTLGDVPVTGRLYRAPYGGETAAYPRLQENSFLSARNTPLSTFSIDVDSASYANVRRFLNEGRMPPRDAVRIEELVNYFKYDYAQPDGNAPFSANIEVAGCPWNTEHRLVRVAIKGREIAQNKRPASNFVFLIDVSGSMSPRERLPLIKQALRQLVKKMREEDRVAIVVYASQAGVKLESTSCAHKEKMLNAIDELEAGGSTNGGDGIQQAYRVAQENFIEGGVNRVLLCTDGDFNVGITDQGSLVQMIQQKAKGGVFLTTLGVGTDNYKDALMQKLADKGNGNYYYLDSLEEAQKVLIDQMNGTLVTIAKDVKIQIEFNPAQVNAYRLIGYEKRLLRKEDFNNDAKDAGEIGAGHTVTALYEIVPAGQKYSGAVDELKYQPNQKSDVRSPMSEDEKADRYVNDTSKELLTLKIRYKQPDGNTSKLLEFPVTDSRKSFNRASVDFKFAAAVAEFGMLLRDSEYKGDSSYRSALELARGAKGADEEGYRSEFITLVEKARELDR